VSGCQLLSGERWCGGSQPGPSPAMMVPINWAKSSTWRRFNPYSPLSQPTRLALCTHSSDPDRHAGGERGEDGTCEGEVAVNEGEGVSATMALSGATSPVVACDANVDVAGDAQGGCECADADEDDVLPLPFSSPLPPVLLRVRVTVQHCPPVHGAYEGEDCAAGGGQRGGRGRSGEEGQGGGGVASHTDAGQRGGGGRRGAVHRIGSPRRVSVESVEEDVEEEDTEEEQPKGEPLPHTRSGQRPRGQG
jgi:hypothetical protein